LAAKENMATNNVVLEGVVLARDVLRRTPGSVATLNLTLQHTSHQREAESDVLVEAEIGAVAFGDVAEALDRIKPNDALTVKGFLARKNRYANTLILHITQFRETDI
jgi:primosomal replication protein PriB